MLISKKRKKHQLFDAPKPIMVNKGKREKNTKACKCTEAAKLPLLLLLSRSAVSGHCDNFARTTGRCHRPPPSRPNGSRALLACFLLPFTSSPPCCTYPSFFQPSYLVPHTSAFLLHPASHCQSLPPHFLSLLTHTRHLFFPHLRLLSISSSTLPWTRWSPRHHTRRPRCATSCGPPCAAASARRPHGAAAGKGRKMAAGPDGVAAAGEFRYDPLSYALNFDDGSSNDGAEAEDAAFRYRNFSSRLPPSPVPASRA